MALIVDIKCNTPPGSFGSFLSTYNIPPEVQPELPDRKCTMHECPSGKIGLYTHFFDLANFRLPLSVFLFDFLQYYRINISQLSVLGACRVCHFEILCRVLNITPTVTLFRCFYVNSKLKGWFSFGKRDGVPTLCTKSLDSVKN